MLTTQTVDVKEGTQQVKLSVGKDWGTGAYVLARYNLLAGRRCTIHWENIRSFREEFPDIDVSADLFAIDRNCITCAGGMAALDMMLRVIAIQHGAYLAHEVAAAQEVQHHLAPGGGHVVHLHRAADDDGEGDDCRWRVHRWR